MRTKMQSKIVFVTRDHNGHIHLGLEAKGKILSDRSGTNKDTQLLGELILAPIYGSEIKIGSMITVEVNDEEDQTFLPTAVAASGSVKNDGSAAGLGSGG